MYDEGWNSASAAMKISRPVAGELGDVGVQFIAFVEEREKLEIAREVSGPELDRPGPGPVYHMDPCPAHLFDPAGKFLGATNRRGKEEHSDPCGRKDDGFFPNVAAVLVGQIVGLIDDDEI